jgi:hypothetical protein
LLRAAKSPGEELGNWTLTGWLEQGGGTDEEPIIDPNAIDYIYLGSLQLFSLILTKLLPPTSTTVFFAFGPLNCKGRDLFIDAIIES